MPNDFYNASGSPTDGSEITSSTMRTEFTAIAAGFSKLPALTANAYKIAYVNAAGTALDVVGGTGLLVVSPTGIPSVITPGTGVAAALAVNVGSAGAPVLFNGNAGTPSALVGTNISGTAASLTAGAASVAAAVAVGGITGLGTGVATWLATPSSANLASAVTDETGSGALVFATSPTLVTPTLGVATATSVNGIKLAATGSGFNVVTGVTAGASLVAGPNTAFGYNALAVETTGTANVAVGFGAAATNIAKDGVTAVGNGAGSSSGNYTTAIGMSAGTAISGQYNIAIGYISQWDTVTSLSGDNNIVIGYQAKTATQATSNTVTLGNSSITTLRCQVTSITALSDARDKTDVTPLPSGLDTVMALKPVQFVWNMRDGGKVGIKDAGFIAQDLQTVDDEYLRLVYAENPDKLEASYGRLIPVLVKAIQELSAKVADLEGRMPS